MSITGHKGIDVRQTANRLEFRAFLQDSSGVDVITGTTNISIFELQSGKTLKTYDFSTNTFKSSSMTSGQAVHAATYAPGITTADAALSTGLWLDELTTLTGFTAGSIYIIQFSNSSASPPKQTREFQFGDSEGDMSVVAGLIQATVAGWVASSFDFTTQMKKSLPLDFAATVVLAASTPTATSIQGDSTTTPLVATDDYYNDSYMCFTSGVLLGIARRVIDYVGASRTFTFYNAWPTAPSAGDSFIIIGGSK